ncbi:Mut7-C RNAse domain-containing protein [Halobacteriaceae bacterium SHR40]|uniref:Mut7-C RNAse domain-containing protein n=1 Tax=Halovenus amylolytica TaxID=2500550 RepID=UPI000FE324CF
MGEKLLLDAMVGRLRTYLRICGHDTLYALDEDLESDRAIRKRAASDGRILITRDRRLATRTEDAILLESKEIEEQLTELSTAGIALEPTDEPEYCGVCNGPLEALPDGEEPVEEAPDDQERIWYCLDCGQQFWKGSHWERIEATLDSVTGE